MTTRSPASSLIESVMQGRNPREIVEVDQAVENISNRLGYISRILDQARSNLKRTPINWRELESDLLMIRDDTIEMIVALRKAGRK
jgi:hypothetical protein